MYFHLTPLPNDYLKYAADLFKAPLDQGRRCKRASNQELSYFSKCCLTSYQCFKQIRKVGKVGKEGKEGKVGKVGKVGREG